MRDMARVRFAFQRFSSEIRRYFSFGEIRGNPPFPAIGSIVGGLGSIFNPGGAPCNYANYPKESPGYLGKPAIWITPSLANLTKGLKMVGRG